MAIDVPRSLGQDRSQQKQRFFVLRKQTAKSHRPEWDYKTGSSERPSSARRLLPSAGRRKTYKLFSGSMNKLPQTVGCALSVKH